jgi:hypothetical protein
VKVLGLGGESASGGEGRCASPDFQLRRIHDNPPVAIPTAPSVGIPRAIQRKGAQG